MTRHCVQFSGGVSSWAVARIVKDEIMGPGDDLILLFADTLIEDEDTYAFIRAAEEDLGVEITRLADGRTPWELFRDEGFLANSRVDICSRVLKRDLLRRWINDHLPPDDTIIYLGIDWTEIHRYERAVPRWLPYRVEAPLTARMVSKEDLLAWARERGLPDQRLYRMGMPHANCGGGCVKAGQGHFLKLLEVFPERFAEWEAREQEVRDHIGKNVAILTDRRGGSRKPLPLTVLRQRAEEKDSTLDRLEFGGCGCAVD